MLPKFPDHQQNSLTFPDQSNSLTFQVSGNPVQAHYSPDFDRLFLRALLCAVGPFDRQRWPASSGSVWSYRPRLATPETGPVYTPLSDLADAATHLLSLIGENYPIRLNERSSYRSQIREDDSKLSVPAWEIKSHSICTRHCVSIVTRIWAPGSRYCLTNLVHIVA